LSSQQLILSASGACTTAAYRECPNPITGNRRAITPQAVCRLAQLASSKAYGSWSNSRSRTLRRSTFIVAAWPSTGTNALGSQCSSPGCCCQSSHWVKCEPVKQDVLYAATVDFRDAETATALLPAGADPNVKGERRQVHHVGTRGGNRHLRLAVRAHSGRANVFGKISRVHMTLSNHRCLVGNRGVAQSSPFWNTAVLRPHNPQTFLRTDGLRYPA